MNAPVPVPQRLLLHRKSRCLELIYGGAEQYRLPFEYLRVFSPSAEVRGHGVGEPVLVPGKRNVDIKRVEPVGRYAVRLVFDDGHDSGLYSWNVLYALAKNQERDWARYLQRLEQAGMTRDSDVVKLSELPKKKTYHRAE